MNRAILSVVLLASIVFGGNAQTKQLKSYDELMASLKAGKNVRAIIYYAKCKLVADSAVTPSPDAIGGMDFKTFEYFAPMSVRNPKAFVTTSETVLISHPRHGYVHNYVKLKIYEDGNVEITARYLAPGTLTIVMDETFFGKISTGSDVNAVYLFEN